MNQENFRQLVAGEKKGPAAAVARLLLAVPACLYRLVIAVRNRLYDFAILPINRSPAKVISIGNLTAGGTGKTPLVIWLANYISAKGQKCAILTRGYKSGTGGFADEPAMLTRCCPAAQVIVNPDRVAGAKKAAEAGAAVLIMDDGFQHRRLHRDIDIVAIDATTPFGYAKMLPAGFLREPQNALKRAHAVVITRADQQEKSQIEQIENRVRQVKNDILIARAVHRPVCARAVGGKVFTLTDLAKMRVLAFCGIGNPRAFFNTLAGLGVNIVQEITYDDHYRYTRSDVIEIARLAKNCLADIIISTEKDWNKIALPGLSQKDTTFAYLEISIDFVAGGQEICRLIENLVAGTIS